MDTILRTPRVEKLRNRMVTTPEICIERAYYMTESYLETEHLPPVLRRAKAIENILNKIPIRIEDGELLAGWPTSKTRGGALQVETHSIWILDELDTVQDRDWERYAPLLDDEKKKIVEYIMPYWKGKTLYEKWDGEVPEHYARLENVLQSSGGYVRNGHHHAHVAANYPRIIKHGLLDTIKELEMKQKALNLAEAGNLEKYNFYKAAIILQKAVLRFAERYAELAESMAAKEADPARKKELLKMGETCRKVPANPPETLYEAVQTVWFVYICVLIEGWGAGMSLGRPDQYLLPFYERDLKDGIVNRDEALEIVSLLLIKLNSAINLAEGFFAWAFAGYPVMCGLTIGGVKPDGTDAVNEMTYIFLDAEEQVGLTSEDIVVRFNRRNPDKYCFRAIEVAKNLKGKLKFVGDESTIQSLLYNGLPISYARDYISTGCHNPTVPSISHDGGGVTFNYARMLELVLGNGMLKGEQIGPQTGDPRDFKSFEDVKEAFRKQYEAMIQVSYVFRYADMKLLAEYAPCTLISSFLDSCLERGVDVYDVGTYPYATSSMGLCGVPDTGDSLAAIKKVVFDDKKITMATLLDALEANFEGYDEVWYLLSKAPKFGNGDEYVDSILREVLGRSCDFSTNFKSYNGRKLTTAVYAMTSNIPFGNSMGATPDGRKAGEPLSEGGISPHQGRNVSGATATLNSVATLDQVKITNGSILNMRVSHGTVKDEASLRKFMHMIRSYFEDGGNLIQFNFTDTATLRAAQKDPDKYRDLLVRVATYSSFFVEISPELQENIIERNEL